MLSNESVFRLLSVGLLGVVFISVTAFAKKEQKDPVDLFSVVDHVKDAEMINGNDYHPLNLTSIGERTEIVLPTPAKK